MTELPRDPITGDGIVLRPFEDTDIDDMVTAVNDPETQRFPQGLPSPYTRVEAARWALRRVPEAWTTGGGHHFAIGDPATGRLLGSIGLGPTQLGGHAAGVGYWVAPWARRQGVATKATRTFASWAFAHGFGRLELTTDLANEGSQRVALAAGFQHEGIRRAVGKPGDGAWRDLVVWSRLATDSGEPDPALASGHGRWLADRRCRDRAAAAARRDADDLLALASLPEVIATSVGDRMPTPAWAAHRCATVGYLWLIGSRITFAICDAETGAFAGDIGLFHEAQTGQAMIGYSVAPRVARPIVRGSRGPPGRRLGARRGRHRSRRRRCGTRQPGLPPHAGEGRLHLRRASNDRGSRVVTAERASTTSCTRSCRPTGNR